MIVVLPNEYAARPQACPTFRTYQVERATVRLLHVPYHTMYHGGGSPPIFKNGVIFGHFWPILLYFQASGISPIDSSRRELQFPLIKMKIGDFFDFWNFLDSLIVQEGSLMLPDGPQIDLRSIPDRCQIGPKSMPNWCQIDAKSVPDRCQIDARSMPDRCQIDAKSMPNQFSILIFWGSIPP